VVVEQDIIMLLEVLVVIEKVKLLNAHTHKVL
jgi:hypothetical protein